MIKDSETLRHKTDRRTDGRTVCNA